jgi:transcriptional regulator with XRE-family HTH domain
MDGGARPSDRGFSGFKKAWYYRSIVGRHLDGGGRVMTERYQGGLGDFLRSRREKLTPKAAGLPGERRRRTPGLRRQEVAELAGIGIDWYIRLEQGRAVSPSAATVDALARALRLSKTEHAHLRALARSTDRPAFVRETVPDPILRMVVSLRQPAYVTGRRWDVLAWNVAASAIFTDFRALSEEDRNILVYVFLNPEARRLFGDGWAGEARRMIAQFRATHDLWAHDPAFVSLTDRLRDGSTEFTLWWEDHDIRGASAGRKTLHHPSLGVLEFEYVTFQSNDDPALKLAIYTPA